MEHAEKVRKLLIFKENSQYGHLSVFSNGFGVIRGEENNHNEEGRYLKPIKKDINDHWSFTTIRFLDFLIDVREQ